MTSVPVEYIAGILDACAIFRIRETPGGTRLPVVAVHGLPEAVLSVLGEATGTGVTIVKRDYNRTLCADHCPEQHSHIRSVTGRWSVTGSKATILIESVLPHLRVQRDAAEEALQVGLAAPRKPATARKMRELGWEAVDGDRQSS